MRSGKQHDASTARKPYATPELKILGGVEKVTHGPSSGWFDIIWGVVTSGTPGDGGFLPADGS